MCASSRSGGTCFGNCGICRVQLKCEQTAAISIAWFERAKMRFPKLLICFNADCDADLAIPESETSDSSQKSLASTKLVEDKCG
jgi:hypothetical protein